MKVKFFDVENVPQTFDALFSQEGNNLPIPDIGHRVMLRNGTRLFGGEVRYASWEFDITGNITVNIGLKVLLNISEQDIDESERLE